MDCDMIFRSLFGDEKKPTEIAEKFTKEVKVSIKAGVEETSFWFDARSIDHPEIFIEVEASFVAGAAYNILKAYHAFSQESDPRDKSGPIEKMHLKMLLMPSLKQERTLLDDLVKIVNENSNGRLFCELEDVACDVKDEKDVRTKLEERLLGIANK